MKKILIVVLAVPLFAVEVILSIALLPVVVLVTVLHRSWEMSQSVVTAVIDWVTYEY